LKGLRGGGTVNWKGFGEGLIFGGDQKRGEHKSDGKIKVTEGRKCKKKRLIGKMAYEAQTYGTSEKQMRRQETKLGGGENKYLP